MEDAPERSVAYLPDDLVVEILSRLPARSLCRSRCVSKSWRALISDPAHRQRFAHTTSCLFFLRYHDEISSLGFVTDEGDGGLPLVDSAFSFLPATSSCDNNIELLDSCNGLLLLRCSPATGATAVAPTSPAFYVVCNPATGEWVALPQPSLEPGFDDFYTKACTAALGFDPSASPHFYVFQLEEKEKGCNHFVRAVEIYSSETGAWVRNESGWTGPRKWFRMTGHMTYFNGSLHLTTWEQVIAVVDARGQTWRTIRTPRNGIGPCGYGFVGHCQGRLIYVDVRSRRVGALVIYALEDYDGEWWTLKHKVSYAVLFAPGKLPRSDGCNPVVAFDHSRALFFFYNRSGGRRLMAYDMNEGRVHVVCTIEDVAYEGRQFFLYVPLYSAGVLDRRMSSTGATISGTDLTS